MFLGLELTTKAGAVLPKGLRSGRTAVANSTQEILEILKNKPISQLLEIKQEHASALIAKAYSSA